MPGIRDRLLLTLKKFPEDADCIGQFHNDRCEIELDSSLDNYRFAQTFWHEIWHKIEAHFKDIKGNQAEEIKADLFANFMNQLLGPNIVRDCLGRWGGRRNE